MKKILLLCLIGLLSGSIFAQTNISGTIASDSVLTLANSPYIVNGSLDVYGCTLTVDSGVVVRFTNGTYLRMHGGAINARWAVFTSSKDTSGGNPQKGDWICIQTGTDNASSAVFDTCQINYGGSSWGAALYVTNSSATLAGTSVTNSSTRGIYLNNTGSGSVVLSGATISHCDLWGLELTYGTSATLTNSTISSCSWPIMEDGTASLVFNGTNNLTGNTNDGIYMNYNYTDSMVLDTPPVPYVFPSDFYVNAGSTLTITSDNILKFNGGHLFVNGALNAVAGVGSNITFTSYRDDNVGGDTNGDGTQSAPHSSDWGGVVFNSGSVDASCVMKRCIVTFAGSGNTGGVSMYDASPTIDSCDFSNNYYGAMMADASNPIFTNNTIGSSQLVPIAMSFNANPVFSNNTFSFSDNTYNAIGILGGTLTTNAVLPIRSLTSRPNVTYLLIDYVVVPVGKTLTINPGVVIKSYYPHHRLVIQGKLVADGTPENMIVFTSAKDDNYGNPNDSNKDGNATVPQVGDWGGIIFEASSDPTSILDYCRIDYASLPWVYYYFNESYYWQGEVTLINASPTISNCQIGDAVYGIYAALSSNPQIINNSIFNTQYTPIAMSTSANPTFTGNTFTNAGWEAIGLIGEHVVANSELKQRTIGGYSNITYVILGDITINSGTNVTVDPGVVIKSNGPGIYVNGGLKAKGTKAAGNVVFTSLKDDNYGKPGDTNGDGFGSSPAANDWTTIRFQATSEDAFCLLDSCIVKFGGRDGWGLVTFTDAGGTLSNSTLSDSYTFGVRCENSSNPNLINIMISNCRSDPMGMSLLSNPSFTNIIFTANGSNGVHILEGTLSSNATLASRSIAGIANVAYIIDNLTIGPSAILTIKPGVVIKFANSWCNCSGIDVQGALVADGTAVQPIVFTSFQDDSNGGDTNNDGNTSVPARGNWNAVDFHASSLDTLNSLTYCNFRYGGSNWWAGYYYGEVRIYDAGVKINHCTFEQSNSTGMGIFGSAHPEILNSNIYNVSNAPIAMSMFSNPTFTTDSILNAVYMAIGIVPETYSVSSTVPIRSIGGFSNITYYMYSTCTVNTGTEITIPAGIVFKGGNWQVNGALSMLGTASQPVVFTDPADDTYGNPRDTQEDGTATQPSIQGGSWITYNDVSTDSLSTVRHAIFRYRDAAIYLQQAAPKFSHNTFDHDNYGLVLNGVSTPVVDSCLFKDLTYSPLRISLVSYPRSTLANLISGSTYRAISVTDETLVQDVTLAKRNFAGINNIPYLFDTYTVASNAVLTIEPGVVLKFWPGSGNGIHVNKGLMAIGGSAADSNIVFTEIRDDFYGGDTNADSTKSSPWDWYPGWNGITFSGESLDPLCQLSHCIIRYAGNGPWGNQAGITTNNASPTITYCRIIDNYFGIVANGSANPIVNYCDIYNDSHLGIYNVNGSFNIDARWNWWGSNTGPTHSGNPGGTGQAVSDDVDYSNYLGTGSANPVMGDVSLNGSVQAFDASLVLKYVVNPTGDTLNAIQQQVADVSGTTGITAYDASLILQYVVNLISGFPAEINTSVKQFPSDTKGIFALQKVSNVQLSIGATTVNRGQSFTIPITLRNFSGVASVYLSLKYDPELISFDVVKATDLSANMQVTFFNDKEKGLLRVAMAGSEMLQSDGDIANLTFSVANDVRGKVSTQIGIDRFLANESDLTQLTSPAEIQVVGKPISYQLDQNYPNPFNPSTTIGYQLPEDNTYVHLVIYSITGQVLKTLVNESQNAGEYKVVWNGTSDAGLQVSSGVYFCRITADKFVQMKKLLLLK